MEYKSLRYIKNIVETLSMPNTGKIIQMGVDDGCALSRLCSTYGSDRVIGFEIEPKISHPSIVEFDLWNINDIELDVAFCDIDPGRYEDDWELRLLCLKWAAPRTVLGGMILTQPPFVTEDHWGENGFEYMKSLNFRCLEFNLYKDADWYQDMLNNSVWSPNASCLYIKE